MAKKYWPYSMASAFSPIVRKTKNPNFKIKFRKAIEKDVSIIVKMIAEDELGK